MDEPVFVERAFDLDGAALIVRFRTPAKAPGGEFQCDWSVAWPNQPTHRHTCGEDGVQALILAMKLAQTYLVESEEYKAGRLTLWGDGDLGLPSIEVAAKP